MVCLTDKDPPVRESIPTIKELKDKLPTRLEIEVAFEAVKERAAKLADMPYARQAAIGCAVLLIGGVGKIGYEVGQSNASHNPTPEAKAEFFTEALVSNPRLVVDVMNLSAVQTQTVDRMSDRRAWRKAVGLQDDIVNVSNALSTSDQETVDLFVDDGMIEKFAEKGINFAYLPKEDPRSLTAVIYKGDADRKIEDSYIFLRQD